MKKENNNIYNEPGSVTDFQKNYFNSKVDYYRTVIRKNDDNYLKKLQKIPDNWDSYKSNRIDNVVAIPPEQKKKLSEIKKARTEEYKFEILYIDHLVLIENTLVSCINFDQVPEEQIREAKNSLQTIIEKFDFHPNQFKSLLLSNAKKAISDLYYFSLSFVTFFKKKSFHFEQDFRETCLDFLNILHMYSSLPDTLDMIKKYNEIINSFFYKTQDKVGIRMEDLLLKNFFEKEDGDQIISGPILTKIVNKIIRFKKTIKNNYDFLKFYYGDQTGKLYRYNFIISSLSQKYEENKIDFETFNGFKNIKENFLLLKEHFEQEGLFRFGPHQYWYIDILHFIYKCCKILEFIYLRSSRYEQLQDLRSDILYKIENEIIYFNKIK